jgi:hypothetical protein
MCGSSMSISEIFKAYEEGKHRRYNLLFAVNGGAFAIAKLLAVPKDQTGSVLVLGNLTLWQLSLGMALFTTVMVLDIFIFGQNMRERMRELFGRPGKLVLILIGLLLCAEWSAVSYGILGLTLVILGYLGSIALVSFPTKEHQQEEV